MTATLKGLKILQLRPWPDAPRLLPPSFCPCLTLFMPTRLSFVQRKYIRPSLPHYYASRLTITLQEKSQCCNWPVTYVSTSDMNATTFYHKPILQLHNPRSSMLL